jgi:hypothetical protein
LSHSRLYSHGTILTVVRPVIVDVPEEPTDLFGDIAADGVDQVLIPLGHGRVGPAHDCHRRGGGNAKDEQDGCGCVACVVEPCIAQPSFREETLPLVIVGIRVERPTVWLGEQTSPVAPKLASGLPLGVLASLVHPE